MNFDLRFPIGILFTLYGSMLVVYGLISDPKIYERSLGININLRWGLALLIFGILMFVFAWLGKGAANRTDKTDKTDKL